MATIEICVDSLESALEADAGGADRIELCSALSTGGLTPSLGLLRAVRSRVQAAVHVMIRPRGGDFLYSAEEIGLMADDIRLAQDQGADGVVFGALTEAGEVDEAVTRRLVQTAGLMQVTFHRAFDLVPDLRGALGTLLETGVHRILTSGGAPSVTLGQKMLAELVRSSQELIEIMPGGGVRADNVQQLARATGAREFHAGLRRTVASPMRAHARAVQLGDPGLDDTIRRVVRAADVRALKQAADAMPGVEVSVRATA